MLTKKHTKTVNHTVQEKPTGTAIIPYPPAISEKLRRICNKYGIRTAFRSSTTLYGAYSQKLGHQTKHMNQRTASTTFHVMWEMIHSRDIQTLTNKSKRTQAKHNK